MHKQIIFFAVMAFASAIGILKMAVLAAFLTTDDFTHYSAAVAVVGLVASIISFGRTDGMVKKFVRLFEFGRLADVKSAIEHDMRQLTKLHGFAILIGTGVAWSVYGPSSIVPAVAVIFLAYATNCFTIISSLYHGLNNIGGVSASAFVRNMATLAAVVLVSIHFGWRAGILAEAVTMVAVSGCFILLLREKVRIRHADAIPPTAENQRQHITDRWDGLWLFFGSITALVPISFDRLWLSHFAPGLPAAQYAFTGIWVGAAFIITGIYIQKFGPDAIRARVQGAASGALQRAFIHSGAVAAFIASGAVVSFVVLYLGMRDIYWQKYDLSWELVAVTVAVSSVQVSRIFDWALIPLDGEIEVFFAAVAFALTAIALFGVCAIFGLGVQAYLISFGSARVVQIAIAASSIFRLERIKRVH